MHYFLNIYFYIIFLIENLLKFDFIYLFFFFSSVSESEEEGAGPMRGFGLHSTRRRVEATDSLSSDEEDDNFEMLTAENLFSTLLSRVILWNN